MQQQAKGEVVPRYSWTAATTLCALD